MDLAENGKISFKGIVRTQNIWLLGLTSIWAHNLFVLWAFEFSIVGGPMFDRPKYTYISLRLSLFLTESLFYSLSKCLLSFPSALPRIANPFFLTFSSYL